MKKLLFVSIIMMLTLQSCTVLGGIFGAVEDASDKKNMDLAIMSLILLDGISQNIKIWRWK